MVKKNPLISLQYGFYNFLYPIQVSERYSYRKIFGRSASVLLKEPHANSLSLTQREVKLIFNGVTLMVTSTVTAKSAKETIKEEFDTRCF